MLDNERNTYKEGDFQVSDILMLCFKPLITDLYSNADSLIKATTIHKELETGYPRCDDFSELIAEIELYDNNVENSLNAVFNDNQFVGIIGMLFEPGDDFGYLIGPIFKEEYHTENNIIKTVSAYKENIKEQFKTIKTVVSENNNMYKAGIEKLNWKYLKTQREMCYDLDVNKTIRKNYLIKGFSKDNHSDRNGIISIFKNSFNWSESDKRENEIFEVGEIAVYRSMDNEILGAVNYCMVEGTNFSRVEYVAVDPLNRQKGIGADLVNYVLNESFERGKEKVYLSTDYESKAVNLYERLGFYNTIASRIYQNMEL